MIVAYVVSTECEYEGETVLGAFGSLKAARKHAEDVDGGDHQYIRGFNGEKCVKMIYRSRIRFTTKWKSWESADVK